MMIDVSGRRSVALLASVVLVCAGCVNRSVTISRDRIDEIPETGEVTIVSENETRRQARVVKVEPQEVGTTSPYCFRGFLGCGDYQGLEEARDDWNQSDEWQHATADVEVFEPPAIAWTGGGGLVGALGGVFASHALLSCEPGEGRSCEDAETIQFGLTPIFVGIGILFGTALGYGLYELDSPDYRLDADSSWR